MRLAIKMVKVLVGYPGKICHRIPSLFANCFVRFRARLTDCVCRGILKLHVEMLSVNTVRLLLQTYLQTLSAKDPLARLHVINDKMPQKLWDQRKVHAFHSLDTTKSPYQNSFSTLHTVLKWPKIFHKENVEISKKSL